MDSKVLNIDELEALAKATTFDEWVSVSKKLMLNLGYSRFLLGLKSAPDSCNTNALIYTDYPAAWRDKYDSANYAAIDPTVRHCMTSNRPLIWNRKSYLEAEEADFFEEAAVYGLEHGVALPIHGPQGQAGMLCLKPEENDDTGLDAIIRSLPMAALLRDYAQDGVLSLTASSSEVTPVHLTSREKEVLQWSASGKTTWEISLILSCTAAAVEFHFKNIRRKFGVTSRRVAMIKAVQQKIITW